MSRKFSRKNHKIIARNLLLPVAAAVLSFSLGRTVDDPVQYLSKYSLNDANEITFEAAKADPNKAQLYIDMICKNSGPPSMPKVVYMGSQMGSPNRIPGFAIGRRQMFWTRVVVMPGASSPQKYVEIEAYKDAFDTCSNECDFKSYLFDHEYYHAIQAQSGIKGPARLADDYKKIVDTGDHTYDDLRFITLEIDAIRNQMAGKYIGCMSSHSKTNVRNMLEQNCKALDEKDYAMPELIPYLKNECKDLRQKDF